MQENHHVPTEIGTKIDKAIECLRAHELVAIPTETVYGLAGNAMSEQAVLSIFKAKKRPHFNPLIVHTHSLEAAARFVQHIPAAAHALANAFWPGPLTLLLEKNDSIPDLVTAGHHKVAIRVPAHPLTLQLLKALPFPLAAPSANLFGYVSATTAQHVLEGLGGVIPYILDGGPCTIGVESTIVDFEGEDIIVRRKGGIAIEKIEAALGRQVQVRTHANDHPVAPGQLKSHYATTTPLYVGDANVLYPQFAGKKIALLTFGETPALAAPPFAVFPLSPGGQMDEAAARLFACMRQADAAGADVIIAPTLPEQGLGAAINDRLKRARYQA